MNIGLCPYCQYRLTKDGLCSFCRESHTDNFPVSALQEKTPLLWLSGAKLLADSNEIIALRLQNTCMENIQLDGIEIEFFGLPALYRRLEGELTPNGEYAFGIPFLCQTPGRYLVTRIALTIRKSGKIIRWHTRDETAIHVVKENSRRSICQVHLQDYAQFLGEINLDQEKEWYPLPLVRKIEKERKPHCRLQVCRRQNKEKYEICSLSHAYLGRSSKTEFSIPARLTTDNMRISGKQAKIILRGENYLIEDCQSLNGTTLNGAPVPDMGGYPLKNGDIIELGSCLKLVAAVLPSLSAVPTLRLTTESSLHYLLMPESCLIGADSHCAITLDCPSGTEPAALVYQYGYFLSVQKELQWNNHAVFPGEKRAWQIGDEIRIADNWLKMEDY